MILYSKQPLSATLVKEGEAIFDAADTNRDGNNSTSSLSSLFSLTLYLCTLP